MSTHLPECGRLTPEDVPCQCRPDRGDACYHRCICPALRAREERVIGALLTADEHQAIVLAGQLGAAVGSITAHGPAREGDMSEVAAAVHLIQNAVLANAAARAYPDKYRLMGAGPVMVTVARDELDS